MAIGLSGSVLIALSAFAVIAPQPTMRAGAGVGGVDVGIRKKPGLQLVATQRTAKDGSFSFKNLSAGSYVITISMPETSNPSAKSYFESPSNMRVAITIGRNTGTFDLSARAGHDIAMNAIRNIKARQSQEKPNEISIDLSDGQQISGRVIVGPKEAP